MLKNWSGQSQDHEFFLFAHSIMNFFFPPQGHKLLFSPTASFTDRRPLALDTCTLIFGECATRQAPAKASFPAKTNLACKDSKI
jgi:hypothetical protein